MGQATDDLCSVAGEQHSGYDENLSIDQTESQRCKFENLGVVWVQSSWKAELNSVKSVRALIGPSLHWAPLITSGVRTL